MVWLEQKVSVVVHLVRYARFQVQLMALLQVQLWWFEQYFQTEIKLLLVCFDIKCLC